MEDFSLIKQKAEDLAYEIDKIKTLEEILEDLVLEALDSKQNNINNLISIISERLYKFHLDYYNFVDNVIYKELPSSKK